MRTLIRLGLFLMLLWGAGFVWFMLSLPGAASDTQATDGIVVLTGGPGRVARGIDLIEAGRAERLLISGVDPVVQPLELAAEVEAEPDLFDDRIDLGKRAANTIGNGSEVAAWARQNGYRSLRVITAADHMPRAQLELEAQLDDDVVMLPDAVDSPTGVVGLAREYTKFAARYAALRLGAT
ncbi:MAG: YdcF family protein [Pacificimonas sp.]